MVFAETFGETGTAAVFFGNQWWLVGLLILIVFLVFLMAYRVPVEGITIFSLIGILLIGTYQLFVLNEQTTQTILFFILMFVGFVAYFIFSK